MHKGVSMFFCGITRMMSIQTLIPQRGVFPTRSLIQNQTHSLAIPILQEMQQRMLSKATCIEIAEAVLNPIMMVGCFWAPQPYNLICGFGAATISCRYFYKHPEGMRQIQKDIHQYFEEQDRAKLARLLVKAAYQDPDWLAALLKQLKVEIQEKKRLVETLETWDKVDNLSQNPRVIICDSIEEKFLRQVDSFETYINDPLIRELCGDDLDAMKKAYRSYVQVSYNNFKMRNGNNGNPATMI